MHQGDYNTPPYYPHPPYPQPPYPPHPTPPPSYASAPPYTSTTPDYSPSPSYSPSYPSFPHHIPDPTPIGPEAHGLYSPPGPTPQQQNYPSPPYYPPYDHHPPTPPYPHYPTPTPYDTPSKPDYYPAYPDESLTGYGRPNLGYDGHKEEGVYAYEGKTDPYGARGTGVGSGSSKSSWSGLFDDYGRAISVPKEGEREKEKLKVVRAVPKAEEKTDVKSGVQKFKVKLLGESGGQGVMDVLCMVGLDGIRMLDPNTSRTLRIYPLETVTRCDKIDSSTFAFWSKTSVDIEPRRIRLQSNSYTTNTILDTVTAATVQFKEMGGRIRPSDPPKALEQTTDKKKGLTDWISKLKPVNEEKDHWVPDEAVSKCTGCGADFGAFNRRHHCRNCGDIFCDKCTQGRTPLTAEDNAQPVRVCDRCMAEVTHRLSKAKEASSRPVTLHSHEDLAKKLQEEMEKNLKISSGSKTERSGRRMREVACPTCTVHLQVQVPSSGSETIECGVCQHPFLVSAH